MHSPRHVVMLALLALVACDRPLVAPERPLAPDAPSRAVSSGGPALVVNVTNDTTAQNETPIAVNPRNSQNFVIGGNDWNYNDGCSVNASLDGGRTWTATLPNGFLPGVTRYTNDPNVPGTGSYEFGGDPAVAFGPDGVAYYACFGYAGSNVALLMSRSTDGGVTWLKGGAAEPLVQVAVWQGKGISRGSTGQFPDHEQIHVAADGTIYATWAQFNGNSSHSPVYVAVSTDGARSFSFAQKVTSGSVRSDQDQRIVTDPRTGDAYLTFDNSVQGGKGTAMYVSRSRDRGVTWSAPVKFGTFQNPVCLFPPYCFNISGTPFRGPGSYPAPAFDPTRGRLYVAYTDIVGGLGRVFLTWASPNDLTKWSTPTVVAPTNAGDRLNTELSIEPVSGRIDVMAYDRSYTGNTLVDVTYASSSDGGATWTSQRVTKSGFDPAAYGVPSGTGIRPFIGDYTGIVSLTHSAAMAWTGPGRTYGTLPTNYETYFGSATP
ncbi:MAG: putative neuraminidase [Gemmatimonadetes bacterium]|nr:putative neuraminidase [Gemmatimonadota bacterium]